MFDLSSGKLILIGVIALVVVGPKELPGLLRQVGRAVAKMREMAGEFRQQFDEAMREADLHEVTKLVDEVKGNVTSNIQSALDPVTDIPSQIGDSMDLAEIGATSTTPPLGAVDSAVSLDLPLPEEPPPLAITAEAEAAKPKRRSRRKDAVAEQAADAEPAPAVAADEPAETPAPRPRRRKVAAETEAEPVVPATAVADEKAPAPKKSRRKKSAPAEDEDA